MTLSKLLPFPIGYCWRETEDVSRTWPYPKTMRVFVTALSTAFFYFLVIALIRGIVSFF